MTSTQFAGIVGQHHVGAALGDVGKRREVLDAATRRFAAEGHDGLRWADVAGDVGVGTSELHRYFESGQHCLLVIMEEAFTDFHRRFVALTARSADPLDALRRVLRDLFDLTEQDLTRTRVLVAEQGLLRGARSSPREEDARVAARARARTLELAWAGFFAKAMGTGAIPARDPLMSTRALLGLYNSVWECYRPGGVFSLQRIAEFFTARALAMLGVGVNREFRPRVVA